MVVEDLPGEGGDDSEKVLMMRCLRLGVCACMCVTVPVCHCASVYVRASHAWARMGPCSSMDIIWRSTKFVLCQLFKMQVQPSKLLIQVWILAFCLSNPYFSLLIIVDSNLQYWSLF